MEGFSIYDEENSILELMELLGNKQNEVVETIDTTLTENNTLVENKIKEHDAKINGILEELPDIIKEEVNKFDGDTATIKDKFDEINSSLAEKVNKGQVSVYDIDKNRGKIDQTYLTDELLQQIAGNTPINAVPADKSVTIQKLAFCKSSSNLFNKDTSKINTIVDLYTGFEKTAEGFVVSDFIPTTENSVNIIKHVRGLVFYNHNREYVYSDKDATVKNNYTFTTPNGCSFYRFYWMDSQSINGGNQQVNEGNTLIGYEPYYVKVSKDYIEKQDVKIEDIPQLPIDKMDFTVKSSNLFNKNDINNDCYVSPTSGNLVSASGFVSTGFIKVTPNTKIVIKSLRRYAMYNENKVYVSGRTDSSSATYNIVINIPSDVHYIRFDWYPAGEKVTLDMQQANEGEKLLPYERFGSKISDEYIKRQDNSEEVKINLPPKIFAVTTKEINIYFQNIINVRLSDYDVDVTCNMGKQLSDRWTAIPTNVATYGMTISLYKNSKMVATKQVDIVVKDIAVGNSQNRNSIIIGDSTIAQDYLVNKLEDIFATDVLKVNLLGTLGTYSEKHNEGRAGWTMHDYRTNKAYDGVINPFYNSTTQDFDFNYYMSNVPFSTTAIDRVVLCLGINDTFNYTSDESLTQAISKTLTDFDFVVNNILAYNADIKIGICVTIPPNESQDMFGESYSCGQTQWRYKRNNAIWIEYLIEHFSWFNNRVTLIPDNNNINAKTGFRDGVHPNKEVGDVQRADTFYYWFKSFEN